MDVTCPRCQTDYEFDDALVSERGTTVKCTNCGHQFRVFRPRASQAGIPTAVSPELWRIDRREGEPLELRSLVELQRAIRAGRVSRTDLLRRGDGPARRVGDIPELEPFFPAARPDVPQHTLPLPTLGGSLDGPSMPGGQRIPAHTPAYGKAPTPSPPATNAGSTRSGSGTLRPPGAIPPPAQPPRTSNEGSNPGAQRPRSVPPPRPDTSLRTPLGLAPYVPSPSANPPPRPPHPNDAPPDSVDPPTVPMQSMSAADAAARVAAADAAAVARHAARATPLPPPRTPPPPHRPGVEPGKDRVSLTDLVAGLPGTEGAEPEPPARRRVDSSVPTSTARSEGTPSQPSREELYESLFPNTERRRKRGSAKWLVALFVIGGLVLVGATVGRPYVDKALAMAGIGGAPSGSAVAARLQDAIAAGDRARTEGDYTVAREAYLRATVIDDKSITAWDGFCSAESELAIAHWIAAMATGSSLERDQASSIGASAGRTCTRWGELARTTEDGMKKAEGDLRPARALAAQGNASGLRLYLPAHANEPILEAMVVLADATKGDPKAVETAAKTASITLGKTPLGTFATPGDVAIAAYTAAIGGPPARFQEALDELSKRAPRHMLLDTLKQLGVSGAGASASTSASSSASVAPSASASTAPSSSGKVAIATTGTAPIGTGGGGPDKPTGDYRDLDKKGHAAMLAGDITAAETNFRAALAQNPSDTDALFALGQIEKKRGNNAGAISNFKSVLAISPGFSSARLMLADAQWDSGQQADAIANYKIYLEAVETGSGADRARQRTGQTEGTSTKPPDGPTE
jgi:predicted Zn finger-like uncharacterized protein